MGKHWQYRLVQMTFKALIYYKSTTEYFFVLRSGVKRSSKYFCCSILLANIPKNANAAEK